MQRTQRPSNAVHSVPCDQGSDAFEGRSQMLVVLYQVSTMIGETRTFVRQTTHVTSPSISIFDKRDERVDVCATSPTSGNDSICNYWNWIFLISEGDVRTNRYREGNLCFLEKGATLRDASEC